MSDRPSGERVGQERAAGDRGASTAVREPARAPRAHGRGERARRRSLGRIVRRGIPLLLVAAAAAAVALYARSDRSAPEPATATPPERPVPVHVVVVEAERVPVAPVFLGQTAASHVVEVRSQVPGYLVERPFDEGTRVEQGQLLAQIDPRPFRFELAEAQARLAAARARLARAELQVERYEELGAQDAATRAEVEEQQKEAGVAVAEVALQQAQIDSAELRLEYSSIESPLTGQVGEALQEVGDYVDAAGGLIAVVQQVDPLYVRYAVTERDLLRWQRLQAAGEVAAAAPEAFELEITLADGRVHPHRGRIDFVTPELSESTGTAMVRGVIPNPEFTLRPGQFVHVRVLGIRRLGVIRVPQQAVLQDPAGASVYVVDAQGRAETRAVELGEWLGEGEWIVERGLQPGDRVIVDRLLVLRPGAPVVVLPGAPDTPTEAAAAEEEAP